jgi:HAD superfamily hydrolase (TIGR01549 family)
MRVTIVLAKSTDRTEASKSPRNVRLTSSQYGLCASEVFGSVNGNSIVINADHADADAVFDKSQHFNALGLLDRARRQLGKCSQTFACEAIEAKLSKVDRVGSARVRDGLSGERQCLTVASQRHLDDIVVDYRGRIRDRRVGVDSHHAGVLFVDQCRDHGVDRAGRYEGLVALNVYISVGVKLLYAFGDSICASRMGAGHHRPHIKLTADRRDSVVIGGDHHVIGEPCLTALVMNVPHERFARQEYKRFSGKPAGFIATGDDDDMPSLRHGAIVKQNPEDRNRYRKFELILFDLDGVLMDTREVMRTAWSQVQQEHGVKLPFESYAVHLGRPFSDIMRCLGLKDGDCLAATYERASVRFAHLAKPFPRVRSSLQTLMDAGRRLGVVTSKPQRRAEPLLDMLGVPFVTVRTPGTGRGKPAPDPLMLAMVEAGVDPADTIYVGDMAVDQQAARRAGVAYAHAGWGYGHPEEPWPLVLDAPSALTTVGDTEGSGKRR